MNNSIIKQNKSGNSGSFHKPRGKAPKKKNSKTKPQESPKPQPSSTQPSFSKPQGGHSFCGSSSRGRGGGPSRRGASSSDRN